MVTTISSEEALQAYHEASQASARVCNEAYRAASQAYDKEMLQIRATCKGEQLLTAMSRASRRQDIARERADKVMFEALKPAYELLREVVMARTCAKDFIRPYVLRGDSPNSLTEGGMGIASRAYWAQIGGLVKVEGERKARSYSRWQLIVTKIGDVPCHAVFDVKELIEEIKNEARAMKQLSLWEV